MVLFLLQEREKGDLSLNGYTGSNSQVNLLEASDFPSVHSINEHIHEIRSNNR